jgi:hypothetical protein
MIISTALSIKSVSKEFTRPLSTAVKRLHPAYTHDNIRAEFKGRSTATLVEKATILRGCALPFVPQATQLIVDHAPSLLTKQPGASLFKRVASQFVDIRDEGDYPIYSPNMIYDSVKELRKPGEDISGVDRAYRHAIENGSDIALKWSTFIPLDDLKSGITTSTSIDGASRLENLCRLSQEKGVACYGDAEGYLEQPIIDMYQERYSKEYNKTMRKTFQAARSHAEKRLEAHMNLMISLGLGLYIKLVKGAYDKERDLYKDAYNQGFDLTDKCIRNLIDMSASFPGKKEVFVGSMNPDVILYAKEKLGDDCVIGNLKGMDISGAMGINSKIYTPVGTFVDSIPYSARRVIENGNAADMMLKGYSIVNYELWCRYNESFGDGSKISKKQALHTELYNKRQK